jgi:hypothetical protein
MFHACSLEWPDSSIDRLLRCQKVALPSDKIGDLLNSQTGKILRTFEGTIAQLGSGARSLGRSWDELEGG